MTITIDPVVQRGIVQRNSNKPLLDALRAYQGNRWLNAQRTYANLIHAAEAGQMPEDAGEQLSAATQTLGFGENEIVRDIAIVSQARTIETQLSTVDDAAAELARQAEATAQELERVKNNKPKMSINDRRYKPLAEEREYQMGVLRDKLQDINAEQKRLVEPRVRLRVLKAEYAHLFPEG